MLSSDELLRRARAHAHERYGDSHGLTQRLELNDPAGAYFVMVDGHGEALRIGDGGFFISRIDGRAIDLGTGHFAQIVYQRIGTQPIDSLSEEELVREIVVSVIAASRPNEAL